MRDALRRERITGERLEQPHVQLAAGFHLPAGARKICKLSADLKRMGRAVAAARLQPQLPQRSGGAHQVERGIHAAVHRRIGFAPARRAPGPGRSLPAQCGNSPARRLKPAQLPRPTVRRNIAHAQRSVAGLEIERDEAVLKIEARGAIVVFKYAVLHHDASRLQVEEAIDGRLAGLSLAPRLRLVGGAVGIDDPVHLGPLNLQIAQQHARAQKAQHAQLHAQSARSARTAPRRELRGRESPRRPPPPPGSAGASGTTRSLLARR